MGVTGTIKHSGRVGITGANISLFSRFGSFFCWHLRCRNPSLVRGGGGDIPRLTFACVPDAENAKKYPLSGESDKEEPGDDDIEVTFENIDNYLGAPVPCRIFVCPSGIKDRPSMFWRLLSGGSGTAAASAADANMQMWRMKVTIPFGGSLIRPDVPPSDDSTEASRMIDAVRKLKPQVEPDSNVAVIIPILVNHKAIAARSKLQLFKVATDKKDKQATTEHKVVPLDVLGTWTNKRKAMPSDVARQKGAKKAK